MEKVINNTRTELKGLSLDELRVFFEKMGEPKFRGEQLFNSMYNHLSFDFNEILNFSKELRNKLNDSCSLQTLETREVQYSPGSSTKKYLFRTGDNKNIESVLIPENDRATLCISTQVGCPLDCKFCATGLMGYKRNLTTGEIVDQYLLAAKDYGKENITNIVYMGMGEPLLNYKSTVKSLEIFTNELTKGVSRNRITVSTSGIAPKIIELADSGLRVKLALSLHSCFEDQRSLIMPINNKFPLRQNIAAIKYFTQKTKTRITFEYTLIKGINDRTEDIKELIKLCRQIPSKINLIPFNSIAHMNPGGISAKLEPTSYDKIMEFAQKLRNSDITVMIRQTQGDDIAAACGQLAVKFS